MSHELYKKHRPKTLKEVVGQDGAVHLLKGLLKNGLPHSVLFSGPSGCGKTTLARILKRSLDCGDGDFYEINCADFRGVDMIRDIRQRMTLAALDGSSRIWLIDECHKLTGDAQNAFLKLLEDTPGHVYFFLATTEPNKLLKTVLTRCTEVKVSSLSQKSSVLLVRNILEKEGKELSQEVIEKIADVCEGSARACIVLLEQILAVGGTEDQQLEAIEKRNLQQQGIDLARVLMRQGTRWAEVAKILKGLDEDPEGVRRIVLGYANAILLNSGSKKAYAVVSAFRDNFFDSGKSGLTAACWEVLN